MDSRHPNSIFEYFDIPALSYGQILTAVFLKVSISNYLTIFCVRTQSWMILSLPGTMLGISGATAMIITTLLSKYWVLNIRPKNSAVIANLGSIPWNLIGLIWVFCIIILAVQDIAKFIINRAFYGPELGESDSIFNKMCLAEISKSFDGKTKYLINT